jgi:hypothetical protein
MHLALPGEGGAKCHVINRIEILKGVVSEQSLLELRVGHMEDIFVGYFTGFVDWLS